MGHSHKKSSNCDLESSQKFVIEQIDGNTEIEDETSNKYLAPEVKNAEVQTEPNLVTVAVKEVAKTYEIFVPLSIRD